MGSYFFCALLVDLNPYRPFLPFPTLWATSKRCYHSEQGDAEYFQTVPVAVIISHFWLGKKTHFPHWPVAALWLAQHVRKALSCCWFIQMVTQELIEATEEAGNTIEEAEEWSFKALAGMWDILFGIRKVACLLLLAEKLHIVPLRSHAQQWHVLV